MCSYGLLQIRRSASVIWAMRASVVSIRPAPGTPLSGYDELSFAFFDRFLKGEASPALQKQPKVLYYTMGLNKWQSSDTWPSSGAQPMTLYLTSAGKANTLNGDGGLTEGKFRQCCTALYRFGGTRNENHSQGREQARRAHNGTRSCRLRGETSSYGLPKTDAIFSLRKINLHCRREKRRESNPELFQ